MLGNINGNNQFCFDDINPFVLAFSNPTTYQQENHILPIIHGDINQDGLFDFGDLNPFIALLYQYND